jgi:hypothetical protein
MYNDLATKAAAAAIDEELMFAAAKKPQVKNCLWVTQITTFHICECPTYQGYPNSCDKIYWKIGNQSPPTQLQKLMYSAWIGQKKTDYDATVFNDNIS